MTETQVLDAAPGAGRRIALVDCDLHPTPSSMEEIGAYLPRGSRERVERHGFFAGRHLSTFWGRHYLWGMGARLDVEPQDGETNVEQIRRQVLDLYGVEVGVLNAFTLFDRSFPDLALDGARAVNDWLVEHYLDPEPRLRASLIVPWEWPELAVREIEERARARRFVQVLMPGEAAEPLGSPRYWPIYEAATAHGLPLGTHIGYYDPHHGTGWPSFTYEHHLCFSLSSRRQLQSMFCEGVFEAVPGVRVVMVEGGVGWATSLRWALDSAWELLRGDMQLERRPSEWFDESVWLTTQPIEEPDDPADFARALEHGNLAGRLLFSTDYPHWDFDSPAQALPRSLSDETRRRIFAGNACELYGLES